MELTDKQRDLLVTLGLNEQHPEQSVFGPHMVPLRNQPPAGEVPKPTPRQRKVQSAAIRRLVMEVIEPARTYAEERYRITIRRDPETGIWFLWPLDG